MAKYYRTPQGKIVEYLETTYNPFTKEDYVYLYDEESNSYYYEPVSTVMNEYEGY